MMLMLILRINTVKHAIYYGNPEIVQELIIVLLDAGADAHVINN
jgi:hypothetical protein